MDSENEIVFGNLALTYLKLQKFDEALEYCNKQIGKVKSFIRFSNFNPSLPQSSSESKRILVKVLLRKATALKQLNRDQESLDTVKEALQYEENNKEGKELLKELETKANDLQVKKSLEAANQLLRDGKVNEALDQYSDLLKKINPNEHFDHLSILLNKTACHLHLDQLDDIISISIRGLKIIRNIKTKAVGFAKINLNKGGLSYLIIRS
jgi:tetratricopeptide (TPR) repeat protein